MVARYQEARGRPPFGRRPDRPEPGGPHDCPQTAVARRQALNPIPPCISPYVAQGPRRLPARPSGPEPAPVDRDILSASLIKDWSHPPMDPLVLVSGIPATGKSAYGSWLHEHHGFVHVDAENRGFDRVGLADAWAVSARLPPPSLDSLVAGLHALGAPVILDWGFPPEWLPLVRAMHAAGITAWWFDGDRAAARHAFVARGTVSEAALDIQMAKIEAAWDVVQDFYGQRIVEALYRDGSFADGPMFSRRCSRT
jgi:hypothetical protein